MEIPVCREGRQVGTLWAYADGTDVELRAVCRETERSLYRLYLRGSGGRVLLGVTEDGCLHRRFSRELLAPAGTMNAAELCPCGEEGRGRTPASLLGEGTAVARCGNGTETVVPWRQGEAFPAPGLFCFARVEPGRVRYLFDGNGWPVMPKI